MANNKPNQEAPAKPNEPNQQTPNDQPKDAEVIEQQPQNPDQPENPEVIELKARLEAAKKTFTEQNAKIEALDKELSELKESKASPGMNPVGQALFGGWIPLIELQRAVDFEGQKMLQGMAVIREDDRMIVVMDKLLGFSTNIAADSLESALLEVGTVVKSQYLAGGPMESAFRAPQMDKDGNIIGDLGGCPRIVVAFMLEAGKHEVTE